MTKALSEVEKLTKAALKAIAPRAAKTTDILWTVGVAEVCEMIVEGSTQRDIARTFGVPEGTVAMWLANLDGQNMVLYAEALRISAESLWLKAYEIIEAAPETTAGVMKAKALADVLMRKAGIRAKAYNDRLPHHEIVELPVLPGKGSTNVPSFTLVIHGQHIAPPVPLGGHDTFDEEGNVL
jgi:transposase